jgi:hypothetical protein
MSTLVGAASRGSALSDRVWSRPGRLRTHGHGKYPADISPQIGSSRRPHRARRRVTRDRKRARMWNELIDHDPTGEILTAWIAKEELRRRSRSLAPARPATSSPAASATSTAGAPAPRFPSCTAWRPQWRPGGRRSNGSSTPARPTPAPRASTGSSRTSDAAPAGSVIPPTTAAKHGSTAPANHAECQPHQRPSPPKFEEPLWAPAVGLGDRRPGDLAARPCTGHPGDGS